MPRPSEIVPLSNERVCAIMAGMGNKNARKREIRKPKKKVPKPVPQRRDDHPIVAYSPNKPTTS